MQNITTKTRCVKELTLNLSISFNNYKWQYINNSSGEFRQSHCWFIKK